MTKIKIDIGKEEVDKGLASGDFEDPPPGLYVVEVRGAEQKQKQGGEHPYINVQAFPVGTGRGNEPLEPPEGTVWGTVWDRVSLSPAARWRLVNFCLAMGLKVNRQGKIVGNLELEEGKPGSIIGKLALLRVKGGTIGGDSERAGQYRAEAGNWAPYDPTDTGDGFEDETGDGLDDEAGEQETFGDDEPDGGDYYTRDELEGFEPGEISRIAGEEFDLDVGELKVYTGRGKSRKLDIDASVSAMIDAILEAQAAPEDSEEPSASEDPF